MHLDDSLLRELAPANLPALRAGRYGGDDMGIRMQELSADDASRIRLLYDALAALLSELRVALCLPAGDGGAPGGFSNGSPDLGPAASAECIAAAAKELARTAADPAWRAAMLAAREVRGATGDSATRAPGERTRLRQALHDVRGGALTALALTIEMAALKGKISTGDVVRSFYLTRDHLKIMRNAIEDVDVLARTRDQSYRNHGTHLLFEKWTSATHRLAMGRSASITVDSTYGGPVSRSCLEFSALDRVVYNLMNNAVRFTSDGTVTLYLREVGENLRFVVVNAVTPEHLATLRTRFGDALGDLYFSSFTTGGEGVGLGICGELVANAYGLAGAPEAVAGGYVGATVREGAFITWFHWPTTE